MDPILNRTTIIVLAQGVLVILLFAGYARRSRRGKTMTTESGAEPATETFTWHPQSWAWPVGIVVLFIVGVLLWRPVSTWYAARHPPAIEHRGALIEAASKELHCPAEQLAVEPFGDNGAKVTGCGGNTRLCWRTTTRYGALSWLGCYVPY